MAQITLSFQYIGPTAEQVAVYVPGVTSPSDVVVGSRLQRDWTIDDSVTNPDDLAETMASLGWELAATVASSGVSFAAEGYARSYGDGTLAFYGGAYPMTAASAESAMRRSGGHMELVTGFDAFYARSLVRIRIIDSAGVTLHDGTSRFASLAEIISFVNGAAPNSAGQFDAYVYMEVHDMVDPLVAPPAKVYGKNRFLSGLLSRAPGGYYHRPRTGSAFHAKNSGNGQDVRFATSLKNAWDLLFPGVAMPDPAAWTDEEFGCFWVSRNPLRKYSMPAFSGLQAPSSSPDRFLRGAGVTVAGGAGMASSDPAAPPVAYAALAAGGGSLGAFSAAEAFQQLAPLILAGGSVLAAYPLVQGANRAVFLKPVGADQWYFDSFDASEYQIEAVGMQHSDFRPKLRPLSVTQFATQRSSGPIDANNFRQAFGASDPALIMGQPGRAGYRTGSVAFQMRNLSTGCVSPLSSARIVTITRKRARPYALMTENKVSI